MMRNALFLFASLFFCWVGSIHLGIYLACLGTLWVHDSKRGVHDDFDVHILLVMLRVEVAVIWGLRF